MIIAYPLPVYSPPKAVIAIWFFRENIVAFVKCHRNKKAINTVYLHVPATVLFTNILYHFTSSIYVLPAIQQHPTPLVSHSGSNTREGLASFMTAFVPAANCIGEISFFA